MLIRSFSFSNFYSFRDEQKISFLVNESAPDTTAYCRTADGKRVTKLLGLVGPNASGKTNLLRVLGFIKHFIRDSFQEDPDGRIHYEPFAFSEAYSQASSVQVEFEIEAAIYRYALQFTPQRVLEEALFRRPPDSGSRFSYVFKRRWDEQRGVTVFRSQGMGTGMGSANLLRANSSTISTGAQSKNELCTRLRDEWSQCLTNVAEMGRKPRIVPRAMAARLFHENPHLLTQANDLLGTFDLGLLGFRIEKEKAATGRTPGSDLRPEKNTYYVAGQHRHRDKEVVVELPFHDESNGTQRLFDLLPVVLGTLEAGGIVLIDEFEVDLHPHMVEKLLGLFTSEQTNPKNAQLLFSCHYTPVLNLLDKYQTVLVEKNEHGESEAWRLDEMKGVRADDNLFAKYDTGAYGAVPKL